MSYRLREGLSYCQIDGHPIFLDIHRNRYFRLSNALENAFKAYVNDDPGWGANAALLLERDILTDTGEPESYSEVSTIHPPTRSTIEQSDQCRRINGLLIIEVLMTVISSKQKMGIRHFGNIIESLAIYRRQRAEPPPSGDQVEPYVERLGDVAKAFNRARLYVPAEPSCLVDSLSMVRFLARRGLFANMVFGVTLDPFAAHCWVQHRNVVLNDTVGNANAHTPIRLV